MATLSSLTPRSGPTRPATAELARALADAAEAATGVPAWQVMGRARPAKVAIVRQVIYYLLRECCAATWEEAGAAFDRDHGTAIHGHRVVRAMLKVEAEGDHRPTAELIRRLCAEADLPVPSEAAETPGL